MLIDDALKAPVHTLGPKIESHPRFPRKVNAGFMQVMDPGYIRVRVYERGVGETEACGTGACAAVVAGISRNLLENSVRVELIGGMLQLEWHGGDSPVMMTGPAVTVYEGQLINE
jgi:diaminopimelate epimerase